MSAAGNRDRGAPPSDDRARAPAGTGDGGPSPAAGPDPATFLSGESGNVGGRRLTAERTARDWLCRAAALAARHGSRLDRLAAAQPPRRVLVLGVYRPGSLLAAATARLRSDRHDVSFAYGSTAAGPDAALADETALTGLDGGKFENLDALLAAAPAPAAPDWTVVVDDDVTLPPRFLDRALALCERLGLDLAQPAQTPRSHAAWRVARQRPLALARATGFVEIGPVTLIGARAAAELLPFPPLRYGWGLDNHWGALARERGWRLGVLDALAVRHDTRQVATTYPRADATAEARAFLTARPFLTTAEAQRTHATHWRLPA
ncbi:MAG: glycosyltransferase [Solirubrobacterales bacterium]|nr:glycosyltransferase [Solirubrobacterales bacterium]